MREHVSQQQMYEDLMNGNVKYILRVFTNSYRFLGRNYCRRHVELDVVLPEERIFLLRVEQCRSGRFKILDIHPLLREMLHTIPFKSKIDHRIRSAYLTLLNEYEIKSEDKYYVKDGNNIIVNPCTNPEAR